MSICAYTHPLPDLYLFVSVSDSISNHHVIPRTFHPFLELAKVLMLRRARHASGLDAEVSASDLGSDSDSSTSKVEGDDEDEDETRTTRRRPRTRQRGKCIAVCTVYIVISILIHQCRARARAHNRELLAQYEVLLYLVPDLHKDIHLLDDKQVGVLAEYVRSLPSLGYLY